MFQTAFRRYKEFSLAVFETMNDDKMYLKSQNREDNYENVMTLWPEITRLVRAMNKCCWKWILSITYLFITLVVHEISDFVPGSSSAF